MASDGAARFAALLHCGAKGRGTPRGYAKVAWAPFHRARSIPARKQRQLPRPSGGSLRRAKMSSPAQLHEPVNPKTAMTHSEMAEFVRNHFEEFVNRKNLQIGTVNFAPEFVDQ